jgi:hypothetical protein
MTHLYSLLPTDRSGLIVKDQESLFVLCGTEARYNLIKSEDPVQKYLYTISVFKNQTKDNKPFYQVLFTLGQDKNIFKMISEKFDIYPEEKETIIFVINANLNLIFGSHEIDVFEYEAPEFDFLEKYVLFYKNLL